MIPEVQTYLAAAAEVLSIAGAGIAGVRAGTLSSASARLVCQSLKAEARRARENAKLPGQTSDARKALKALADDVDQLRAMARKLI